MFDLLQNPYYNINKLCVISEKLAFLCILWYSRLILCQSLLLTYYLCVCARARVPLYIVGLKAISPNFDDNKPYVVRY